MLSSIVRLLRLCGALFVAALILQILVLPAGAGERAEFDGAMIVIDIGSHDAARAALAPIADILE